MSDDAPTTLDDYRVRAGNDRVILMTASRTDDGRVVLAEVGISTDEARRIAADLTARAERVERERS